MLGAVVTAFTAGYACDSKLNQVLPSQPTEGK